MTEAAAELPSAARVGQASGTTRLRLVSWVLLVVVVVVTLGYGITDDSGPGSNAERAGALAQTIACPRCSGQSVAESEVPIAREIRADIARRVERGETNDQIRQVYVDRYGEWVDLNPGATGVTGLVWIVPVLVVAAGAAALIVAFMRWRTLPGQHASAADEDLVARALDDRAPHADPGP